MSNVAEALKRVISEGGVEQFNNHLLIEQKIDEIAELSVLERNLLKRCVTYDLYPETIFVNESAAIRAAQRIANVLIKKHGIVEKQAQETASAICSAFSEAGIQVNAFKEAVKANEKSDHTVNLGQSKKEDKPKKKGLFSFFKRG